MSPTPAEPLVLVTGAAGKIGRYVTAALLKQGCAVRGLTTKPVRDGAASDGIEWRSIDFTRSLDLEPHLAGCAAVVHLAAEIVDETRMQRVNVEATQALTTAARDAGVGVFCYVSSASVYGSSRSRLVTESSPTVTPLEEVKGEHWAPPAVRKYARTKLLGERQVIAEAGDMRVIIVRPTVVVDVQEVSKLVARGRLRKALVGRRHMHHVYVADVAEAIVWLVKRGLADPAGSDAVTIYNIAEDHVACRSYSDLTRRLRAGGLALSVPSFADRLVELARFGALPWRYSLGQMIFSSERLETDGFRFPHGVEALYRQMAARETGPG